MKTFKVYGGDCLDVLKTLPDNSIDSVVTDPPYGLSFMGKKWDYDVPSVEIWAECLRVLKPGGHLLAFAGTRTQHRMAVRIEDAGFEIRDMIAWVYGSGFPKSHDVSKAIDKAAGAVGEIIGERTFGKTSTGQNNGWNTNHVAATGRQDIRASATEAARKWQGWGTALKPALEPITVARKPLIGTVADNVLAHGTGALNVDGCRVGASAEVIQRGELDSTFTNSAEGYTRANRSMMTHKPKERSGPANEQGRWPANLIHDGSEDVLALTGDAARFFYCAKASKRDRDEGLDGFEAIKAGTLNMRTDSHSERNGMTTNPRANNHPTVKPTDLMRYLCRLVTPPNGTVLDPFTGSGSTGKAAILEGFNFIGIEREAEYVEIAKARIFSATLTPEEQQLLF
jgi:site-specific DNA-methyltransferase (adenine-specific)